MEPEAAASSIPEFTQSAKQYVEAIITHAERPKALFLYSGANYEQLAHFLLPVTKAVPSGLGRRVRQPHKDFVSVVHIDPAGQKNVEYFETTQQQLFEGSALPQADYAQLVFISGHLSPEWLAYIGCKFSLDPEFFRRHYDFMNYKNLFDLPALPSASKDIIRLRVPTICTRSVTISLNDIERHRRHDCEIIERYQKRLVSDGAAGDSIVRRFSLHNEKDFTIEQNISICIKNKKKGGWIGVILLDSGRDMDLETWNSIAGGSSFHRRTTMDVLPVIQHRSKLAFADLESKPRARSSSTGAPASSTFTPSLCLFPQDYGVSLDPKLMRQDAMYALSEVFNFAASAESQFLNFMKAEIVDAIRSFDGQEEISLNNLRYNKILLDEHIDYIIETANVIRGRGPSSWPKLTGSDERHAAEVSEKLTDLRNDYEHLLNKAHTLASLCSDGMNTIMNNSMLHESRRAIKQSEATRRLTILAFLFVPLSMVASVFGMNVVELGQGNLEIWVPFVVLVPILGISVILCFWDEMPWKGREEKEGL